MHYFLHSLHQGGRVFEHESYEKVYEDGIYRKSNDLSDELSIYWEGKLLLTINRNMIKAKYINVETFFSLIKKVLEKKIKILEIKISSKYQCYGSAIVIKYSRFDYIFKKEEINTLYMGNDRYRNHFDIDLYDYGIVLTSASDVPSDVPSDLQIQEADAISIINNIVNDLH